MPGQEVGEERGVVAIGLVLYGVVCRWLGMVEAREGSVIFLGLELVVGM